jgi:hypothetical protein
MRRRLIVVCLGLAAIVAACVVTPESDGPVRHFDIEPGGGANATFVEVDDWADQPGGSAGAGAPTAHDDDR